MEMEHLNTKQPQNMRYIYTYKSAINNREQYNSSYMLFFGMHDLVYRRRTKEKRLPLALPFFFLNFSFS